MTNNEYNLTVARINALRGRAEALRFDAEYLRECKPHSRMAARLDEAAAVLALEADELEEACEGHFDNQY